MDQSPDWWYVNSSVDTIIIYNIRSWLVSTSWKTTCII